VRLLDHDFAGLLHESNLHPWYYNETLYGVVETRYDIDFDHDFDRFDSVALQHVRSDYAIRVRWFLELFDAEEDPVYFVRRYHPRDGEEDERKSLRLFDKLRERRPDLRFLYLHADRSRAPRFEDGYRSTFVGQHDPFQWRGDQHAWHYILSHFALRPFKGDHQTFPLPERKAVRFG